MSSWMPANEPPQAPPKVSRFSLDIRLETDLTFAAIPRCTLTVGGQVIEFNYRVCFDNASGDVEIWTRLRKLKYSGGFTIAHELSLDKQVILLKVDPSTLEVEEFRHPN